MRIRTVKPEFWRSYDVAALSREDRLLFLGLWSYVDDNGVGIDDHRLIVADLFALDDDQKEVREFVREGLATLSRRSLIARYEVSGRSYLFITGWHHQRVDKPNKPRYPLPPESGANPPTSDDGGSGDSTSGDSRVSPESPERDSAGVDTGRNRTPAERPDGGGPDVSGDAEPNGRGDDQQGSDLLLLSDSRETRESPVPVTEEQGNRGTGEKRTAPARSADAEPPGFAEFYEAFPRKRERIKAAAAYRKALRRGAAPERILRSAQLYALQVRGKDLEYVKYPASWLNAGAYEDEPERPSRGHQWGNAGDWQSLKQTGTESNLRALPVGGTHAEP